MHTRKGALDLSGRHRESILRACSTFSVVPYLTTLFNYGGTMITVELLQQNELDTMIDKTDYWHPCKSKHHPQSDESDWHPSP
jgi:hypothetical protein